LKEFFHYLRHGHEEGGRWHLNKPARPDTVKDYRICLNSFFKWPVTEGMLGSSPMEKIPRPAVRLEEKQPLSPGQGQVKALRNGRGSVFPTVVQCSPRWFSVPHGGSVFPTVVQCSPRWFSVPHGGSVFPTGVGVNWPLA
jgi:hypothetical protein